MAQPTLSGMYKLSGTLIHVGARNNALAMLVDKSQRVDSLLRTM